MAGPLRGGGGEALMAQPLRKELFVGGFPKESRKKVIFLIGMAVSLRGGGGVNALTLRKI